MFLLPPALLLLPPPNLLTGVIQSNLIQTNLIPPNLHCFLLDNSLKQRFNASSSCSESAESFCQCWVSPTYRAEAQWQAERPQQMVPERERGRDGKAGRYTARVGFTDLQINIFLKILFNLLASNYPPPTAFIFCCLFPRHVEHFLSPPFLKYPCAHLVLLFFFCPFYFMHLLVF